MAETMDMKRPTDEELVSYLDGELTVRAHSEMERAIRQDTALADRVDVLRSGRLDFEKAFEDLLHEAPLDRLRGGLATAEAQHRIMSERKLFQLPEFWTAAAAAFASLVILGGGILAGRAIERQYSPTKTQIADQPTTPPAKVAQKQPRNWRQAIADYHALFTAESFTGDGSTRGSLRRGLRNASSALGIRLGPQRLKVAPLELRRSQILSMRGAPLVQIGYLTSSGTPLSFCIIKSSMMKDGMMGGEKKEKTKDAGGSMMPDQLVTGKLDGFNIVEWSGNGFGYLLIGDVPETDIKEFAERLKKQVT